MKPPCVFGLHGCFKQAAVPLAGIVLLVLSPLLRLTHQKHAGLSSVLLQQLLLYDTDPAPWYCCGCLPLELTSRVSAVSVLFRVFFFFPPHQRIFPNDRFVRQNQSNHPFIYPPSQSSFGPRSTIVRSLHERRVRGEGLDHREREQGCIVQSGAFVPPAYTLLLR